MNDTTATDLPLFVTIGQGRAVHAAAQFTYPARDGKPGSTFLGASCDRHGFANLGGGRKVRPAPTATAVTCKSCLRLNA